MKNCLTINKQKKQPLMLHTECNCFLVVSDSLWPQGTAARQASPSFTISWSLLQLMSIKLVMLFNYLILCCAPFSSYPNVCPFNINSDVEILTTNVMVLGGGDFGRWLGHEGGALKNGIRALIRDPGELPTPNPCEGTGRSQQSSAIKKALTTFLLLINHSVV